MKDKIDNEMILKRAKLSAKKKLKWLYQMHEFTRKFMPKDVKKAYFKLRESDAKWK